MTWITLLVTLLPLIVQIYKEWLSAEAQAKADGKQFKLDQATFHALVQAAIAKQVAANPTDSAGASSGWDQADKNQ